MKKKKVIVDFAINILAYSIPVFVTHLIVNPYLAKVLSADTHGIMLTMIATINVLPHSFGHSLNNLRLVYNCKLEDDKEADGNINILLLAAGVINTVLCGVVFVIYAKDVGEMLFFCILSMLWLIREYCIVFFRLKLSFKDVLFNNILIATGYLIGLTLFKLIPSWIMIYFVGQIASCAYILVKTRAHLVYWKKTKYFNELLRDYGNLILSNLCNFASSNLDKLIIYPMLGGIQVTTYYASTIFTKIISMVITPLNSVILSYLSHGNENASFSFKRSLLVSTFVAGTGYFACLFLGKIALKILYPQYADMAEQYLVLTSASSMLMLVVSIVRPYVLMNCKMYWQVIANVSRMLILLTFALILIPRYGIWGMCISAFAAATITLFFMIVAYVGFKNVENENNEQ